MDVIEDNETNNDASFTVLGGFSGTSFDLHLPLKQQTAPKTGLSSLPPANPLIQRHYRVSALAEIFGVSHATIWRYVKKGVLSKPRKIGVGRTVVWSETEVVAFLQGKVDAA